MSRLDAFAKAVAGDAGRCALTVLCILTAVAWGAVAWERRQKPVPILTVGVGGDVRPAERYLLPITPPLDQGNSGLCWVFAALSMLETNYMSRHPGAHVEFSRAAVQRDLIADRFHRLIRGEPEQPSDGGLAVEALQFVRQNGLFDRGDFHDVVDSGILFASLGQKLAGPAAAGDKERELHDALRSTLGDKPPMTHFEGKAVSPEALAKAVLADKAWTEFDLARDGGEGWGPSHDPEARPETRVRYVRLDALVELIRTSLKRGEAVVAGTDDHAFLVYGAEYDKAGRPVGYFVKDSIAPYLYRADAESLHRRLNDVTVALGEPGGPTDGSSYSPASASEM